MHSQYSSQNSQSYNNSFYPLYLVSMGTNICDTTIQNNIYSPVSSSNPANLLSPPNNNGYLQYIRSSNSPVGGPNDFPMTPMAQCTTNLITCTSSPSPYSTQYLQHSPMQATYNMDTPPSSNNNSQTNISNLQDFNNISNISNNNNNNDYYNCNKENQRPNKSNRNNNNNYNKRFSKLNNNYTKSNKNMNLKQGDNSYMQNDVQMQENNQQGYNQMYQESSYYCNPPIQSTQSPALSNTTTTTTTTKTPLEQRVNDSYASSNFLNMPLIEPVNYQSSALPLTPLGYTPLVQPSAYHHDNIDVNDDYQDPMPPQNNSSHDKNLACQTCRGRTKCFCYFIKVGYHQFPSYKDYQIHQYNQMIEFLRRTRRM